MQVTIARGAVLIVTAVVWGAIACGGKTEEGGDGNYDGGAAGASGGGPAGGSSGSGSGRGGGGSGGPITPLEECKMGTPPPSNFDDPCAWLAKNLCYETKEAACACICPRDKKSTC